MQRLTTSLLVKLADNGDLIIEYEWGAGNTRQTLLPSDAKQALAVMRRILQARTAGLTRFNEDGNPTQQWINHSARHIDTPSPTCPFCAQQVAQKTKPKATLLAKHGDVKVRLLPQGTGRALRAKAARAAKRAAQADQALAAIDIDLDNLF